MEKPKMIIVHEDQVLLIEADEFSKKKCRLCDSYNWWRLKSSPHWKKNKPKCKYQKWICENCHPSIHPENNIERLK